MAAWDVTVNGVNLNTPGTGVSALPGFGKFPGRNFSDVSLSGVDGISTVLGGLAQGQFGMALWVDGVDMRTGAPPSGLTPEAQAWRNLEWIMGLFSVDLLVTVAVPMPNGVVRQAVCKMTAATEPEWFSAETCRFNLAFEIPTVCWESPEPMVTVYTGTGGTFTLPDLADGNAIISDAVVKVLGPATTPVVSVINPFQSGNNSFVQLKRNLTAGQVWTIDSGQMTSKVGTTSVLSDTSYAGRGQGLLRMSPTPTATGRYYQLSFTGGATATAATRVNVSAKVKWY